MTLSPDESITFFGIYTQTVSINKPENTYQFIPLYRYWQQSIGDHFYTTDQDEVGSLEGWELEDVAFYVSDEFEVGLVPLYRYWHPGGDHFYTTDQDEGGALEGWELEGIACYVFSDPLPGLSPVYRYWNLSMGDHFYTIDQDEVGAGTALGAGWTLEGVAFYVSPTQIYSYGIETYNTTVINFPSLDDQEIPKGSTFNLDISASSQTHLNFNIEEKPSGASFIDNGDNTATFSWIPDETGVYTIIFKVTGGESEAQQIVNITVYENNHPPIFYSIGNKSVYTGTPLIFQVIALDEEGDNLSYSVSGQPIQANFNASNGYFTWPLRKI